MPGGDRTGPLGLGPRTGRAAGYCAGYGMPGYMNPIPGRGSGYWGWGRGRGGGWGGGRGWRHGYYATGLTGWQRGVRGAGWSVPPPYPVPCDAAVLTPEQEIDLLQADLRCLEQSAERIRRRIDELSAKTQATGP